MFVAPEQQNLSSAGATYSAPTELNRISNLCSSKYFVSSGTSESFSHRIDVFIATPRQIHNHESDRSSSRCATFKACATACADSNAGMMPSNFDSI